MQILVVEDDEFSVQMLLERLEDSELDGQITVAYSLKDSKKLLLENNYDLIFLDVHLQDGKSTELINEMPPNQKIIFITGDPNYAIRAFEYNALDYIVKPINAERFKKSISRIKKPNEAKEEEHIVIRADYQFHKIKIDDIRYIKANGDYISINTSNNTYTFYGRLKNFLEKLTQKGFIQCHRSYIVNTKKITGIDKSSLLLNEEEVPVSKSFKKAVTVAFTLKN